MMFRNHKSTAQPFEMGNPDGDTVVLDQGGGYRTVMQEIIEELEAG